MDILPSFDLVRLMTTPDLPLYGQLFAYGIGLAGIGIGLKQIVGAISQILEWFRKCKPR